MLFDYKMSSSFSLFLVGDEVFIDYERPLLLWSNSSLVLKRSGRYYLGLSLKILRNGSILLGYNKAKTLMMLMNRFEVFQSVIMGLMDYIPLLIL
ncbi:hypothetical protein RCL_jg14719.t1 [Rhizophagus clarus]|uniref:Uncharacterized protein n=1 Tax=Rhizophagus clarus TaxID=94130 RepID=A0A8H3M0Z5_9GLOM|nr:hypothetical protein RCL_jg14719.t1 [Rhizophagus clarus]